jgi:hypothetical protein
MDRLPVDTVATNLAPLLRLSDVYFLSQVSREYQELFKRLFFREFKRRLDKRLATFRLPPRFDYTIFSNTVPWRMTGSLILSVLLDQKWSGQDIDIFFEGSIIVDRDQDEYGESGRRVMMEWLGFSELELLPMRPRQDEGWRCILGKYHFTSSRTAEFLSCNFCYNDTKCIDVVSSLNLDDSLDDFDVRACASYFDGKYLQIPDPSLTLRFQSKYKPSGRDPVNRKNKYLARGFTLLQ